MFENLLVGVDEHQGGKDAIALARNLAPGDATFTLANVHPFSPTRGPVFPAEVHERGLDLLAERRREAGIEAKLCCFSSTSVGRGLHELAESVEADLLVVGSSHRGLFGRVMVGDDTRAAMNGAPCAVAIAPTAYAEGPHSMHEIGVGYDGSLESELAIKLAEELAVEHGARLSACEVVSLPAYALVAGGVPLDGWIESLLAEARQRISALGDIDPHVAYGQPVEELALYGASVDLLVVGSRGYGPLGRLVHGSTSIELARNGRCPLLVLPRASHGTGVHDSFDLSRDVVTAR